MYFYKSYILTQRTSSRFLAAASIFFVLYELVSTVLNFFFTKRYFSFTLHRVLFPLVLAPTWCIFMTAPKSQNLCQKVFKRFCMPSKSVMKVNIMKLKCLFENKRLTIIFKNLNCSSKAFRWWQKLFWRLLKKTSKRRQEMSFFSWDERTNFERTKDVHFTSRADWWIIHAFHDPPHLDFSLMKG